MNKSFLGINILSSAEILGVKVGDAPEQIKS